MLPARGAWPAWPAWLAWLACVACVACVARGAAGQGQPPARSPCPAVFSYEESTERDRWQGSLQLTTDATLYGVWIDVVLDRQAESLGNWFGDVTSSDKKNFKIENTQQTLYSGSSTPVRFFVKYNTAYPTPKLKNLRLNGREICMVSLSTQTQTVQSRNSQQDNFHENDNDRPIYSQNDVNQINKRNERPSVITEAPYDRPQTTKRTDPNDIYSVSSQSPSRRNTNTNTDTLHGNNDDIDNDRNQNTYGAATETSYERPTSTSRRPQHNVDNIYNQQPVRGVTSSRTSTHRPSDETTDMYGRPIRPQITPIPTNNKRQSSNDRVNPLAQPYDQPNVNQFPRPQTSTRRTPKPKVPSYSSAGESEDDDYPDSISPSRTPSRGNNRETSHDYYEGDHRIPQDAKIRPTPLPDRQSTSQECGKVAVQAAPLILSGQATVQGQWPWHVAIYQSQTVEASKYICGGSLVTASHVITAAHCVTRKNTARIVNHQTLTIYLGKFNLRKSTDGVQIMLVQRVFVHPEYNGTSFYADVSILKLTRASEYTNYVRPVCLWKESEVDFSYILEKEGSVVGWGFDEDNHVTEELALVRMPVVKHSTCLWSFREFFTHFTSNHSYCAGFANGTSVCNGDSGGGMVFPDASAYSSTPTWRLRGLVSISVARQNENICDPYHYVVFTDLALFLDWVKEKLVA